MSRTNDEYIVAVQAYERSGVAKLDYSMNSRSASDFFLEAYGYITGGTLSASDLIVDFGCGGGDTTIYMNGKGYNVHGVDILKYWDTDAALYGGFGPKIPASVRDKLHVIDPSSNRLPFDDASVSMVFSDQTLEHVFDYRPVFAEQARVLTPGGIAIHRFPHGYSRLEPHTKIPVTPLTRFDWYLKLWALSGFRNIRQGGLDWRATVESNKKLLATANYASDTAIVRLTDGLGVEARFQDFLAIAPGRAGQLYRTWAARGLGPIARQILKVVQDNRVLVLRKVA